ncbi:MAG: tellurite resistance/C4-dicarboxylate transporter family protein [Nocardioides sp.]|nr:tellurite resistance/C4-dicarboxylate transporter family protein [Nocardioides sp.]
MAASSVARLTPGYFALVMACGIVSIGLSYEGHMLLSRVLFAVGVLAFIVLLVLNVWRFISYREEMAEDFRDPKRAFGFFTFVAGTNVLGSRAGLEGWYTATTVALVVGGLVWLVLGYVVPWSAVLGRVERPVLRTANGTWFIAVVASQSVAIACATLAVVHQEAIVLPVLAVLAWSVGIILYAGSALFVSMRLLLYPITPEDFDPPYWVSMGAVAITVVAGANIVEMVSTPMVDSIRGLAAGLSVVFWCFATWLIPVLFATGLWRHAHHRVPLRYEPTLWSMVFPLGMYSVASISLGRADHLPLVEAIGSAWLWVALTAWALVLMAMVWSLLDRRAPRDMP